MGNTFSGSCIKAGLPNGTVTKSKLDTIIRKCKTKKQREGFGFSSDNNMLYWIILIIIIVIILAAIVYVIKKKNNKY